MLCKLSFTFLQYLPEHSSISRNRRTIPYLVFHLSLAFLHSKLRAFSSGNYNVRVVPTKSSLNVYQARYVITHNVVAWCVHLGHKPNHLIKNIVGKNLSMTQKYWNCALRRLTLFQHYVLRASRKHKFMVSRIGMSDSRTAESDLLTTSERLRGRDMKEKQELKAKNWRSAFWQLRALRSDL